MNKEEKRVRRVAVFPAGSEIGLEINSALKYSTYFELIGLSSVPSHAEYVYENYIEGIPFYKEVGFIDVLNRIIEENNIDFIYPAYDDIQLFLTEHQTEIKAEIITSDLETVRICRSKEKTYQYFASESFVPKVYNEKESFEFPVFIKPDIGQGSQGARLVNNREELKSYLDKGQKFVIAEYLPGEEYTVDCISDGKHNLLACSMRNRKRIKSGISVSSEIIEMPEEVQKMVQIINKRLCFIGAWFFQIKKRANGKYCLLEIAPRIAGTMGVSRNKGINYPLLSLFIHMNMPVQIIKNEYDIAVDRALISRYHVKINYNTAYVDLDDTLIVRRKVNAFLMMFLYQLVNEKKRIILITKHLKKVEETLSDNKISKELFDQIIVLNRDQEKSDFVTDPESIFIDDSFSERIKVSEKCHIPVFDCSEVESLVDWRV